MSRENLITLDLTPLHAALADIGGELKRHWTEIMTLSGLTDDAKTRMGVMDRHMTEVKSQCELFQQGLDSITHMDDKLNAWSDRLRSLEERQLQAFSMIHDTHSQVELSHKHLTDELFALKQRLGILQEENPVLKAEVGCM